jgi:ribosome-binding ATPase YchF (GTP1/OBG family)
LRRKSFAPEEEKRLKGFSFLTVSLNFCLAPGQDQAKDDLIPDAIGYTVDLSRGLELVKVYGRLEMEMAELSPEEESEFAKSAGIEELGRERLIRSAYRILRLISFFTVGKDEVRAWTIRDGSTAVEAAGASTRYGQGFIRPRWSITKISPPTTFPNRGAEKRDCCAARGGLRHRDGIS